MLTWPSKDPNEVLDYSLDWAGRLAGSPDDTIATTTATASPAGLTIDAHGVASGAPQKTTTWLSGGSEGVTYALSLRAVTTGGRTMDETVRIKIKSR